MATASVLGLAVGACATSTPDGASPAVQATCTHVTAILSDGPDPTADPVGYAEAQIVPLDGVHSSDRPLQKAMLGLDAAYRAFYMSDGSAGAQAEETHWGSVLDAICPGATG